MDDLDKGHAIPLWDEFFPPRWDASQAGMCKVLIYLIDFLSIPSRDGMVCMASTETCHKPFFQGNNDTTKDMRSRLSQMDSVQFSDLKEFLSDCIKSIKKAHPNLSSAQLAKRLDLASSSFSRFENREITKPSFNHALKIVREACGETRVQDFIKLHYPDMYNNLTKTYPGNSELEFMPEEAEVYLQDPTAFELIMMASCNAGLRKEVVVAEFGNRGLLALENLIAKKILVEQNQIFTLGKKNLNFGQETVKKLLQNLVNSSYDLNAFGTQKNWLSVQYESVDKNKVTPKLRDVYIKANKEIREIFNAPENAGSDVMWAGLAMDSLLKKEKQESNGVIQ